MAENPLLKIFKFSQIDLWDYNSQITNNIKSNYPMVSLGNLVTEKSIKVSLKDEPDEDFRILGISNEIGMFDKYISKGKEFNQKYKYVDKGWIAYNPYRVNVGSIGIKSENIKYEYISPAYVVFSCNNNLNPDYLMFILKSEYGIEQIRNHTTGSVRQILGFDKLCEIKIPLPTMDEQNEIMGRFYEIENQIEELKKALNTHTHSIPEDILYSELKIKKEDLIDEQEDNNFLKFVRFKNIDRWDYDFNIGKNNMEFLNKLQLPIVSMEYIIKNSKHGLSSKSDKNSSNVPMLRMNNIQDGKLNLDDLKYVPKEKVKSNYFLKKGDLLFNRTNSKELVGKTAIFKEEGEYTFASYLIRIRINENIADVEYINFLFSQKIIRKQIDCMSRQVTGQVNINNDELRSILVPLPSLQKQKSIMKKINAEFSLSDSIKDDIYKKRSEQLHIIDELIII